MQMEGQIISSGRLECRKKTKFGEWAEDNDLGLRQAELETLHGPVANGIFASGGQGQKYKF